MTLAESQMGSKMFNKRKIIRKYCFKFANGIDKGE